MRISKKNQYFIFSIIKYLCICILVLLLGILYSCQRKDGGKSIKIEVAGDGMSIGENEMSAGEGNGEGYSGLNEAEDSDDTGGSGNSDDNMKFICVHIAGFVVNPGVYNIAEGARIYEVVRLAGGFLPEADESYLNLASVVFDGQKIMVLSKEEAKTAKPFVSQIDKETEKSLININTATKEQLMQLAGIGESRALSIISYREKHGEFKKIEDIMKISGIKEAAFEKIKDYICVD
ncbi:MAG: helix-hairpin-helix domain-containing protein [Lachnospiraceae bacterium]|nr:helix-hairpin-helix domain-containing protein [Lachnospiraceae bacterium]